MIDQLIFIITLMSAVGCGLLGMLRADKSPNRRHFDTIRCNVSVVTALAGKKDSNASSERVMSTGVPKTVVVLRNERMPTSVTI